MAAAGPAVLGLALTGCTPSVAVDAAPHATDPVCASIVLATPDEVDGLARRATTSQATTAWGDPDPIVLRCGVEPPAPTDAYCTTVTSLSGESVDWLGIENEGSAGGFRFVTYGRSPAVEVRLPAARAQEQATAVLTYLGAAVNLAPAERHCT